MEKREYLFLVGAPRSGTTWLQLMLSQCENICTSQETHLFSSFLSPAHKAWHLYEKDNRSTGLQAVISYPEFLQLQRQYALSILNRIGEAPIVLEKTPAHLRVLEDIMEVLPEARFIHIIRDPRAVAASLAAAARSWGSRWASTSAARNAKRWHADVEAGIRMAERSPNKIYQIRYEDLSVNTSKQLFNIFDWIGIRSSLEHCEKIVSSTKISKLKSGSVAASWDMATEPNDFYRTGKIDSWKDELSHFDIVTIEEIAGTLMDELGYEKTKPHVSPMCWSLRQARQILGWRLVQWGHKLEGK